MYESRFNNPGFYFNKQKVRNTERKNKHLGTNPIHDIGGNRTVNVENNITDFSKGLYKEYGVMGLVGVAAIALTTANGGAHLLYNINGPIHNIQDSHHDFAKVSPHHPDNFSIAPIPTKEPKLIAQSARDLITDATSPQISSTRKEQNQTIPPIDAVQPTGMSSTTVETGDSLICVNTFPKPTPGPDGDKYAEYDSGEVIMEAVVRPLTANKCNEPPSIIFDYAVGKDNVIGPNLGRNTLPETNYYTDTTGVHLNTDRVINKDTKEKSSRFDLLKQKGLFVDTVVPVIKAIAYPADEQNSIAVTIDENTNPENEACHPEGPRSMTMNKNFIQGDLPQDKSNATIPHEFLHWYHFMLGLADQYEGIPRAAEIAFAMLPETHEFDPGFISSLKNSTARAYFAQHSFMLPINYGDAFGDQYAQVVYGLNTKQFSDKLIQTAKSDPAKFCTPDKFNLKKVFEAAFPGYTYRRFVMDNELLSTAPVGAPYGEIYDVTRNVFNAGNQTFELPPGYEIRLPPGAIERFYSIVSTTDNKLTNITADPSSVTVALKPGSDGALTYLIDDENNVNNVVLDNLVDNGTKPVQLTAANFGTITSTVTVYNTDRPNLNQKAFLPFVSK